MNYLITGGAGFIGSHLVDRLLADNNKVTVVDGHSDRITVIDDFSYGKYENLSKNPKLIVYNSDILSDIGRLFKDIDVVFHLAGLTRPQWSIKYPFENNQVNVAGTIRVLEHARNNKVKRVVFVSSSSLYGDQDQYPTPESSIPNPMNPYALTKLIGEEYCKLFERLYGLEWNAIRPFNVYGSRMPLTGLYTSAVATFIDVIKKNLPPQIIGDGKLRRDFIYVDDLVDMMILMAHSKVHGEVFNCGSGTNTSINELYEMICEIMESSITPIRLPSQFEPLQTLADVSKAKNLLGWKPKTSLEEGLRKTIEQTL